MTVHSEFKQGEVIGPIVITGKIPRIGSWRGGGMIGFSELAEAWDVAVALGNAWLDKGARRVSLRDVRGQMWSMMPNDRAPHWVICSERTMWARRAEYQSYLKELRARDRAPG